MGEQHRMHCLDRQWFLDFQARPYRAASGGKRWRVVHIPDPLNPMRHRELLSKRGTIVYYGSHNGAEKAAEKMNRGSK